MNNHNLLLYFINKTFIMNDFSYSRTKLMKLLFLAERWVEDEDKLSKDKNFAGYEFYIYTKGPFSFGVMEDFEKLKDEGILSENLYGRRTESEVRILKKGESLCNNIMNRVDKRIDDRINKVLKKFGSKSGEELKNISLEYLDLKDGFLPKGEMVKDII